MQHATKATYSLRSLTLAMTLFAWVLGINYWLGAPYGYLTAIPLVIGLPVFLIRPWSMAGALAGFIVFAIIAKFYIIGWEPEDPEYFPAIVTVGAYGSTVGGSIQAFFLRQKRLALVTCILTLAAFAIVLRFG